MADDTSKPGSQDRKRINRGEGDEVNDGSRKFGASAPGLEAAVQTVGSSAQDVEAFLDKSRAG